MSITNILAQFTACRSKDSLVINQNALQWTDYNIGQAIVHQGLGSQIKC